MRWLPVGNNCFAPPIAFHLGRTRVTRMFSQFGQDEFVVSMFGGMRDGFFVEAGAYDGVQGSNTLLLEQCYGWSGICVEPNDRQFARLVRNRACRCVHACLYERETEIEFVEDAASGAGILDSYHPAQLEFVTSAYKVPLDVSGRPKTVTKTTRTIKSVLEECSAPRVIDYFSLDTEGSELAILRSFPFDEYSIRLLTVEHCWLPNRERIQELLESRGFHRVETLGIDDCFVGAPGSPRPPWRSGARLTARRHIGSRP